MTSVDLLCGTLCSLWFKILSFPRPLNLNQRKTKLRHYQVVS